MIPSDCGNLLRACSYFDNRKVTDEAMIAWSHAIHDGIGMADAMAAIAVHHGESNDWCGPSHVNKRVEAVRRERLQRAGDPPIPGDLTYSEEKAWRQLWCSAVKDGDSDPVGTANRAMRLTPAELPAAREDRVRAIEALAISKAIPPETKPVLKRRPRGAR